MQLILKLSLRDDTQQARTYKAWAQVGMVHRNSKCHSCNRGLYRPTLATA